MTVLDNVLDAARDDMSDPDVKLNRAIWIPQPIASMSLLAALREAVLIRSSKRMPKWKFRAASDVVIQIQPRADDREEPLATFDCRAIMRDGATGDLLTGKRPHDCWQIEFLLRDWEYADFAKPLRVPAALRPICLTKEAWNLKPLGVGYFVGKPINDIFAFRPADRHTT